MVLYATDLVELEKPQKIKQKRVSKKKTEEPVEIKEVEVPEKPKRKRVPKKKVEEIKEEEPKEEIKKEELKKEEEKPLLIKDAPPKKTRKRKQVEIEEPVKEPETVEQTPESPTLVEEPEPKKTRKIKVHREPKEPRTSGDPPEWFKKYVAGVQKEKASSVGHVTKKQEKEIKTEALKTAHKSWQSGVTRDRVQGEVDSHMNRMYSMIFSGR